MADVTLVGLVYAIETSSLCLQGEVTWQMSSEAVANEPPPHLQ
jgi:hypothetical protein